MSTQAEQEIRTLLEGGFEIFVKGDLENMPGLMSEDVLLVLGPNKYQGLDTVMAFYTEFYMAYDVTENYPMTLDFHTIDENNVVVVAHERIVLTPKMEGLEHVDSELMVTFSYTKRNGQWLMVYEHAASAASPF